MERIKSLDRYQKGILLGMLVMAIAFLAAYAVTISRVGFLYKDVILTPGSEGGSTVYSGRLRGQPARFTVSADKTVTFQHGQTTYGPYTAREDAAAVPQNEPEAGEMTGIELRCGDAVLFRGGVLRFDDGYWLYDEDGTIHGFRISYVTSDGVERDEYGNEIDPAEPSASDILNLMEGPKLTHKGEWPVWFGAVFVCALNALLILFADELFRLNLSFQIRNAYLAQPSDLEIAGRYVCWTALAILALVFFVMGLQ